MNLSDNAIGSAGDGVKAQYGQANSPPSNARKLNFLGWAVLLLGIYALNGTKFGHEIVFYSMVLIVLFLFVYNYNKILPVLTKQA